jgi:hypothetical protein
MVRIRKKAKLAEGERTFRVAGTMTISMHVDVVASSPEEAIEKAKESPVMSLCHQCSSGEEGAWNTSGEFDSDVEINEDEEPEEV